MNTSGFCTFVTSIFSNSIPESEIFNGYTTFMMCNKRSDDKRIWHHRMNWLVNNYIKYGDCNASNASDAKKRDDYCQYYIKNIVDDYSGKYLPPFCRYNQYHKENDRPEKHEQDDIFTHYINVSKKFEYVNGKYLLKNKEILEEDEVEYMESNYHDTDLEVFEKKKSSATRLVNFLKKKDDVCKDSDALCDFNNYNSDYSENEIYHSILEEDSEEYDD